MNKSQQLETSLEPATGWHCSHFYYRFDRAALAALDSAQIAEGREQITAALDPSDAQAPTRMQSSLVSGHKADFGLMLLDPDPLKIEAVNQQLLSSSLGPAIVPTYSFVSLTEISEYVPSVEQYGERLVAEGVELDSPAFAAKVKAYEGRLAGMNKQRITPVLPEWPSMCFYPMNKKRKVGENWFSLPFSERSRMMSEHARSGMAFAGKVTQLISVSVGLDDWEWGVTLWAARPDYLKDIVYRMRFDEASARYGEFGEFYTSYVMLAGEILDRCRV